MPRLCPERLTPATVVAYVLDKPARRRYFYDKTYYERVKKVEETDEEKKKKKQEYQKEYQKAYRAKQQLQPKTEAEMAAQKTQRSAYYQANKEHLVEVQKKWNEANKDKVAQTKLKYYQKIKKNQTKTVCECGSEFTDNHFSRKRHNESKWITPPLNFSTFPCRLNLLWRGVLCGRVHGGP